MYLDVFDRNPYGTDCWLLAADGTDADLTAQIRARLSIYRRRSVTRDHRLRPAVDDSLPDFR